MSSTMNTILDFVSTELAQFDFAVVTGGTFFDAAHKLPSCLVIPGHEKTRPRGPLSEEKLFTVELQMRFAGHGQGGRVDAALEKAEEIVAHFSGCLIPSLAGHVATTAEVPEFLNKTGKDGREIAAPSILLTFTVLQQV